MWSTSVSWGLKARGDDPSKIQPVAGGGRGWGPIDGGRPRPDFPLHRVLRWVRDRSGGQIPSSLRYSPVALKVPLIPATRPDQFLAHENRLVAASSRLPRHGMIGLSRA